jgi:polyhydroxybutyrate depolymerase
MAGRGEVLSVDRWAELLVANNGATGPAVASYPPDTSVRAWRGATPRADVEFWRVEGGGHVWPGGFQYAPPRFVGPTSFTFDASGLIWRFFASHSLA